MIVKELALRCSGRNSLQRDGGNSDCLTAEISGIASPGHIGGGKCREVSES